MLTLKECIITVIAGVALRKKIAYISRFTRSTFIMVRAGNCFWSLMITTTATPTKTSLQKIWFHIDVRTVPTFTTVHTFCASRDGPRKSGFLTVCPLTQRYFCAVYNYAGKADLGKEGLLESEKKIRGNHVFFRDIKLQFGKKSQTLLCILALF